MPALPITEVTESEVAALMERPEPYWLDESATPRGLTTEAMLRWLQSDNIYVNPVTQQRFRVVIKTKEPELHKFVQEKIRIAARVVCADEIPELTLQSNAIDPADTTASLDEVDLDPNEEAMVAPATADEERIQLGFTVLDDLGVSAPHCVLFAIEPPIVLEINEAGTGVDKEQNPSQTAPPTTPIPRQPISATRRNAPYEYTCDCKTISASVQISELQVGGLLTATIYSISRQKVLKVRTKMSIGNLPVWHRGQVETIQLSVDLAGAGAYKIHGFHTEE